MKIVKPLIIPTGPQGSTRREDELFAEVLWLIRKSSHKPRSDMERLKESGIHNYANLDAEVRLIVDKKSNLSADMRNCCMYVYFSINHKMKNNDSKTITNV